MNYISAAEEKCWTQYFEYLCSWSGLRPDGVDGLVSYRLVLKALFEQEFYWVIDMDANRASDGLYQRAMWLDRINAERVEVGQEPFDFPVLSRGANCLEVLIGLAWRIEEDFMRNDDVGDRSRDWFWLMLKNAGLLQWDDLAIVDSGGERFGYVQGLIRDILDRKFSRDGVGGFFPIASNSIDARTTQLWDLAMVWLSENYYDRSWLT